ncbi:MAG: phosphotransferase, partial [Patulibacter sp.]|nr:phosphotransferase [Patulibacter sp.]
GRPEAAGSVPISPSVGWSASTGRASPLRRRGAVLRSGRVLCSARAAVADRCVRAVVADRRDREGLRALHDTLPVLDCPFEWSTAQRTGRARAAGADPDLLGPEPPTDRVVVCHGDPCTPNTLIGADGKWAGHVDFDALGIADRWADLGVATMALGWNYGPGWDGLFHEAYGLPADEERTAWYRALWNLDDDGLEPAGSTA